MSVTLTAAGDVYVADATQRKDLIRFSPSVELSTITQLTSESVGVGETVSLPIPVSPSTMLLLFVYSGSLTLSIDGQQPMQVNKTMMLMGTSFSSASVTGVEADTMFDAVIGG